MKPSRGCCRLRVEKHLVDVVGLAEGQLKEWRRHWISTGFDALEAMLGSPQTGRFCHGDAPGMADCFLVPQVYNSQRATVGLELARWPTIERIYRGCLELEAFASSLPMNQPDAEELTGH